MHLDPDGQVGGIARVERQAGQVEPAFLAHVVVAARAVVADEGVVGRGRLDRTGRPDREQGQHREPEESRSGRAPPIRNESVAHEWCPFPRGKWAHFRVESLAARDPGLRSILPPIDGRSPMFSSFDRDTATRLDRPGQACDTARLGAMDRSTLRSMLAARRHPVRLSPKTREPVRIRHAGENGIHIELCVAGRWQAATANQRAQSRRVVPRGLAHVEIVKSVSQCVEIADPGQRTEADKLRRTSKSQTEGMRISTPANSSATSHTRHWSISGMPGANTPAREVRRRARPAAPSIEPQSREDLPIGEAILIDSAHELCLCPWRIVIGQRLDRRECPDGRLRTSFPLLRGQRDQSSLLVQLAGWEYRNRTESAPRLGGSRSGNTAPCYQNASGLPGGAGSLRRSFSPSSTLPPQGAGPRRTGHGPPTTPSSDSFDFEMHD